MQFDWSIMFLTAVSAVASVLLRSYFEAALLIFSLQLIADVANFFSIAMRMFTEMQNFMTSAQRIFDYTNLEQEDGLEKATDPKRSEWPSSGKISFKNVTMRYRDFLEPAVEDLDFEVQSGMKVGIVGRTGSGKSSIL